MASPQVHHLFHHPIADHSFSADRQTLAVARDNNVELYKRSESKFTLQDELKGHDKTVTSVDIAPSTGRIVTCSQGRSSPWSYTLIYLYLKPSNDCILTSSLCRPQCLRLGTLSIRLEANTCPPADQSCSNVREMVTLGAQIRCGIWRSRDRGVLL